jgi:hypothetical protein
MKFIVMLERLIKLVQHGESVAAIHAIGVIALKVFTKASAMPLDRGL